MYTPSKLHTLTFKAMGSVGINLNPHVSHKATVDYDELN